MGGVTERDDSNTSAENTIVGFETSGSFFYRDDDAQNDNTETHDITITPTSSKDTNNVATDFIGTFTAAIGTQAVNDPNGLGEGEITWSFGGFKDGTNPLFPVNEMAVVDALAAGETITQVFTVTITEDNGGLAYSEIVTITITGTNDTPIITAANDAATITELPDNNVAPAEGTTTLSETGTISFDDVDTTDMHTGKYDYISFGNLCSRQYGHK